MKNDSNSTKITSALEDIEKLFQLYSELEELSVQLLEVNIKQLDGVIDKKEAEARLYELASRHIDLDKEIYELKKKLGIDQPKSTNEKEPINT